MRIIRFIPFRKRNVPYASARFFQCAFSTLYSSARAGQRQKTLSAIYKQLNKKLMIQIFF
jgi:hypothetical protein